MKKAIFLTASAAALALALHANVQAQEPIRLVNLLELTGAGASVGTNYNNGVLLAVKEINAAGGVLGHKFDVTTLDTQTNPSVAKALAQKAVDMNAFAVVGPTFSGSMMVSMNETRRAEIPNFTGGAAAAITQQGDPYVIRTHTSQALSMPKLARYMHDNLKAKTVDIIWINNDMGKGGLDNIRKALAAEGVKVGVDIPTEQGQLDFASPVIKAKQGTGDILFVYTNEEESARALRELRKQGYSKPIVGDTTLISQKTIELAGDAANGVQGLVPLTADAPQPTMRAFDEKFTKEYHYRADHNGIQGYMVPYIIKAVSEKIGKVDPKAFNTALRTMVLSTKTTPGVLLDMKYDQAGDADRISYIVEVKNGKQVVTATLPPSNPF